MQPLAIQVEHLTVHYEKTAVLWDISLGIPQGKMVGIIGPNGAGKSTFLKALVGMLQPVSGNILFRGEPLKRKPGCIAYVPQRASVDWDFPITVLDVVLMGRYGKLGWFKRPTSADREAARTALDMVGMHSFAHRQIDQLSGGQQQRVFIARALLQDADIYLMDEPLAGIDHASEKVIIALFDQLKSQDKTLMIVYHDLSSAALYFDWVVLLNTCLIGCGPIEEVFTPQNIERTYGSSIALLTEAAKLSQHRTSGLDA